MAEAMLVGAYDEERVTTPGGGYNPGDIVVAPSGRPGVVQGQRPLESGEPSTIRTTGKYDVASASATTFTAGASVGWDNTNKLAVAEGDFVIGTAARAKTNGQLSVQVIFNDPIARIEELESDTGD